MHLEWSVVEKTQFAFWLWSELSFSCLIFAWERKEAARIPFKARIHLQYINCFHPYVHGGESIPSSCAVSHSSLQLMLLGIPSVRLCHVVENYILAFKISRVPWVIVTHSGMHCRLPLVVNCQNSTGQGFLQRWTTEWWFCCPRTGGQTAQNIDRDLVPLMHHELCCTFLPCAAMLQWLEIV